METKNKNTQLENYLQVFLEKWYITVISVVLCLTLAFLYVSFFRTETYEAFTTLYIIDDLPEKDVSAETKAFALNEKLAQDYSVIAVSNRVLKRVRKLLPDAEINTRNISVTNIPDSRILRLAVTDIDAQTAARIANEITDVLIEEVNSVVGKNNIKVVDHAEVPQEPRSISLKILLAVSLLLGVLIGFSVSVLIELSDTKIKGPGDIETQFDLPIIGLIPKSDVAGHISGKEDK